MTFIHYRSPFGNTGSFTSHHVARDTAWLRTHGYTFELVTYGPAATA